MEEAIRSVLLQDYPNLEYVVVDGESRDESLGILERYSPCLTHWVSEPDAGQYDAINKGFDRTTGDIMAWINADDRYEPGTFFAVAQIFAQHPRVEWLTTVRPIIRCEGQYRRRRLPGYCRQAFLRGEYAVGVLAWNSVWIPQESTFWRRSLWGRAGGRVDPDLGMAGDFELWARFFEHAELLGVDRSLACFRRHAWQKTTVDLPRYTAETRKTLTLHGGRPQAVWMAAARALVTRLPGWTRQALVPLGLAYRSEIIVPDRVAGRWRIVEVAA